jgi:hypothetical protein
MIYVILFTAISMCSLFGWGRFVGIQRQTEIDLNIFGRQVFCGFLSITLVAHLIRLFQPISIQVSITLLAIGFGLFIWYRGYVYFINAGLKTNLFFAIVLVFISILSLVNPLTEDSGLYHVQATEWLRQWPLVFGVANIHERFGNNSIWWTISTALNPFFGPKNAVDVSGAVLFTSMVMVLWPSQLTRHNFLTKIEFWFLFFIFVIFGQPILFDQAGSPANDFPVNFMWILTAYIAVKVVSYQKSEDLIFFISLSALGIMIKASSIFTVLFIPLYFLSQNKRALFALDFLYLHKRSLLFLCACSIIWFLNGFVASGCWLWPAVQTCYPKVSWSLPDVFTIENYKWIKSWARLPLVSHEIVLANDDWLRPWLRNFYETKYIKPLLKISVFLAFCLIFSLVTGKKIFKKITFHKTIFIWLALSLIFWFVMAPDLRFGSGLVLSIFVLVIFGFYNSLEIKWLKFIVLIVLIFYQKNSVLNLFTSLKYGLENYPISKQFKVNDLPAYIDYKTNSGVLLKLPDPKSGSDKCWFAELPCTPYPRENLIEVRYLNQFKGYNLIN